jgi:hypothetical protein
MAKKELTPGIKQRLEALKLSGGSEALQGLRGEQEGRRNELNLAEGIISMLRPHGPGTGDHNGVERLVNIVTSIPYSLIGLHTMR